MKTPAKKKNLGGRPATFKQEFCQIAIDTLAEIDSLQDVADKCGVSYSTMFDWMNRIPEFKAAVQEGRRRGKNALIKKALDRTFSAQPFRENTFKYLMAVMYGVREKTEVISTTTNTNTNINAEASDESTVNRLFEAINAKAAFATK